MSACENENVLERGFAAQKAAVRLMETWGCTDEEAACLFEMNADAWKVVKSGSVDWVSTPAQLNRLSYFLRIYVGLSVFSDGTAHAWPKLANTGSLFQGLSPVELMIVGGEAAMSDVAKMTESLGW